MNEEEEEKEMNETLRNYLEAMILLKARLRNFMAAMSIEEMKEEMRLWATEDIETCCETVEAIENENYEICQAALEVLKERKTN
jgi:hypothetical protein